MIPVLVGALGTIPKKLGLSSFKGEGGIEVSVGVLQKVALLETARILGQVFGEDVVV